MGRGGRGEVASPLPLVSSPACFASHGCSLRCFASEGLLSLMHALLLEDASYGYRWRTAALHTSATRSDPISPPMVERDLTPPPLNTEKSLVRRGASGSMRASSLSKRKLGLR